MKGNYAKNDGIKLWNEKEIDEVDLEKGLQYNQRLRYDRDDWEEEGVHKMGEKDPTIKAKWNEQYISYKRQGSLCC